MEFRLYYRGGLRANGPAEEKQNLRLHFHKQLKSLWLQRPVDENKRQLQQPDTAHLLRRAQSTVGAFRCTPIVSSVVSLAAELDILFLRPQRPGAIVTFGGDIDNRIKTLLDGLRMPKDGEIAANARPSPEEIPLYCLREDDVLITRLGITTDQLLHYENQDEVVLIIRVIVKDLGTITDQWPLLPLLVG